MSARRVAVTGVGVVSALGRGADGVFERLLAGAVGVGPVRRFDASAQRCRLAAEVPPDALPAGVRELPWSRSDALALAAATEALGQAALPLDTVLALAVGATTGGMAEAEGVLAELGGAPPEGEAARRLLGYPLSGTVDHLREELPGVSRAVTVCSACSSSAVALAVGAGWVASGRARRVLAGGTDGLCRLTFAGFDALGALATEPCRPFDVGRSGLTLGEGAAFLLLEDEATARARGARILAWFSSWALGAEAHHVTQPDPSGAMPERLVRRALAAARLTPEAVSYVNAHGTGTPLNDALEVRALRSALGASAERTFLSSSKAQVGHTLGAAGALEAAITVQALVRQAVPPTAGLAELDPDCRGMRHVLGTGQGAALGAALSCSFGFGGTGAVLLFEAAAPGPASQARSAPGAVVAGEAAAPGRPGAGVGAPEAVAPRRVLITGVALSGALGEPSLGELAAGVPAALAPGDPTAALDPARSRRFDRASGLLARAVGRALEAAALSPGGPEGEGPAAVALVTSSAFGNVSRSVAFLERLRQKGPRFVSPAEFPQLVPSAPAGNCSIYHHLTGPAVTLAERAEVGATLALAAEWVEAGVVDAAVAGPSEAADPLIARVVAPLVGGHPPVERPELAAMLVLEGVPRAGARPLAVLTAWHAARGDGGAVVATLPPRPAGAEVLLGPCTPAALAALERSGWAGAPRSGTPEGVAALEASTGLAAARAVARIAVGAAPAVLVLAAADDRAVALLFVAPPGAHAAGDDGGAGGDRDRVGAGP